MTIKGVLVRPDEPGGRTYYQAYTNFVNQLEEIFGVELLHADLCGPYSGGETLDNRTDERLGIVRNHCKDIIEFHLGEVIELADSDLLTSENYRRHLGFAIGWLAYYEFEQMKNRSSEDRSLRGLVYRIQALRGYPLFSKPKKSRRLFKLL